MKSKNKIKPLDSKFFNDLANKIYNTKTRKFLRLCNGRLTNGPDPENSDRKMHCGLGELYFAMTGEHTKEYMGESDVINITMDNLSLKIKNDKDKENIKKLMKSMKNVDLDLKKAAISSIEYAFDDMEYTDKEEDILNILDSIPQINDNCGANICYINDSIYRQRSQQVAKAFRLIAKKLAVKAVKKNK